MKKSLVVALGIVLVIGVGAVLIIPVSRFLLMGLIRGEPFAAGRPLSYWIDTLKDSNPAARQKAVGILGTIGPQAVPPLIRALGSKNPRLREGAVAALAALPPYLGAVPPLIQALDHPNARVRAGAARALGQIGPAARAALPALCTALKDPDDQVRVRAAHALGQIGPAGLLHRGPGPGRTTDLSPGGGASAAGPAYPSFTAVRALLEALKDRNGAVRAEAAWALDQIGPDAEGAIAVVPVLQAALKDRNADVRRTAGEALRKIGPEPWRKPSHPDRRPGGAR